MTPNTQNGPDRDSQPPASDSETARYGELRLGDGAVIIYDRDNPSAWIQSDAAVAIGQTA